MRFLNRDKDYYGPYIEDVVQTARLDSNFIITPSKNYFGGEKEIISFVGNENDISLSNAEKEILKAVIDTTKTMYFNDFIDYVYSTYPVRSKEQYSYLDLEQRALEYNRHGRSEVLALGYNEA